MTLDSRPVSLDALSAEDGAAVALAVSQAASENTRRAYRQQWAAFTTWASAQGYPSLPALDATLAAYLTLLAGQGFALASVRQARGAVVKAHQLAGFPTPAGPVTAAALLGLGRSIGAAQGQAVYLGQAAMTALAAIRPADVDGAAPIFGLSVRQLPRRIQAMARAAGLDEGFSGHSGRVGMAQDLAAGGAELPALMVAGRWQSPRMPARYTEKQALGRGAVARYYQERGGA